MFEGLGTAIITPFKKGEVDLDAYNKLLDYQVSNGVKNIIVCGTTGEATTLSNEEQMLELYHRLGLTKITYIADTTITPLFVFDKEDVPVYYLKDNELIREG